MAALRRRIPLAGTATDSTKSELSIQMMSMPLEKNPNYYKRWNNNLYVDTNYYNKNEAARIWKNHRGNDGGETDSTWYRDTPEGRKTVYEFAKSPGETGIDQNHILCLYNMTKPGVDCYELPIATITESSRHNKKSDASWALTKRAGLIGSPSRGDFNITARYGGNWRCDGGSVQFDGKKWVATRQWTWSPNTWDKEIYQ